MTDETRKFALNLAVQSGGVNTATDIILTRAAAFTDFLMGGTVPEKTRGRKAAETKETKEPAADPKPEAKTDSKAADVAATSSASTGQTAAGTPADDDWMNEGAPAAEPEKKYELKDVRVALVELQTAVDKDTAMKVLKDAGGAESLGGLKPEKFAAVIKAANERKAKGK